MDPWAALIGVESDLSEVLGTVRQVVQQSRARVVGACQVACSDEAEWECTTAFQRWFAERLLPALKPGCHAPFRSINLGGRYEWGAVGAAEAHFASPESRGGIKLLVLKINAHVGVGPREDGVEYGRLERYGSESPCCGALCAMLAGQRLPALDEIRQTFQSSGRDRLAALADPRAVAPRNRALLAAMTEARLQSERAVQDILEHQPATPTRYLVLPCVSLNRPGPETELLVGVHEVDATGQARVTGYRGLGDDPGRYRLRYDLGRLRVTDDHWAETG